VARLGAVQAQDYPAARWAVALRMRDGATAAGVDRALNDGRIIRTHVLRPTWHFVAPVDLGWMLELTAPRVRQALAFANRYYELDPKLRARATRVFERALGEAPCLTRQELGERLKRARVDATGVRLALLTIEAELEGVICNGPLRGAQMTYALRASRVPAAPTRPRDEALGELTRRYLASHGPASIRDLSWWSGLTMKDARRGVEIVRAQQHTIDDIVYWTIGDLPRRQPSRAEVHLLPIYDEYLVAYRDLAAVPRPPATRGRLQPAVVIGGGVVGTWRTQRAKDGVVLQVAADRRLTAQERRALARTAARYQRFAGVPVSITSWRPPLGGPRSVRLTPDTTCVMARRSPASRGGQLPAAGARAASTQTRQQAIPPAPATACRRCESGQRRGGALPWRDSRAP